MDLSTTLAEIVALSVDERIRLVEAIWDSIAAEPGQPALTEAQQQELEWRRFPYSIFSRVESQQVVVLAVFHSRRNPRIWQTRT